ncbi:hypothetical protein Tco_1213783 [Tanacetum coccineum]
MLVIKIFSERKKVFRERKKCEKIRAKRGKKKRLVTLDLEGHEFEGLYGGGEGDCNYAHLEEVEKLEWWFEQDINDEEEEDEEGEGGSEVWKFDNLNNEKDSIT